MPDTATQEPMLCHRAGLKEVCVQDRCHLWTQRNLNTPQGPKTMSFCGDAANFIDIFTIVQMLAPISQKAASPIEVPRNFRSN